MSKQPPPNAGAYHTRVIVSVYQGQTCRRNRRGYNPDKHGSCSDASMTSGLVARLCRAFGAIQEDHKLLSDPTFRPDPESGRAPEFVWVEFYEQLKGGEQGRILHCINRRFAFSGRHIHAAFGVTS